MNNLVSVIIPIYKVEKYLAKCIDSVLNQTYKNLEIILVDDGSPDNCGKICDEYALKDSRIKVIHKKNGGLSDARNAGLDLSCGEYVLFVDSDDYIHSDMINILYTTLKRDDSDMAVCNVQYVDENDNNLDNKMKVVDAEKLTGYQVLQKLQSNDTFIISCAKLYKKVLFEQIRFPVGRIHEDEFIAHRLFNKCKTVSCISQRLYYYLQREGSITNVEYTCSSLDGIEALIERTELFFDNSYDLLAVETLLFSIYIYGVRIVHIENDLNLRKRKRTLRKLYRKTLFSHIRTIYRYTSKKRFILTVLFLLHSDFYNFVINLYLKIRRR